MYREIVYSTTCIYNNTWLVTMCTIISVICRQWIAWMIHVWSSDFIVLLILILCSVCYLLCVDLLVTFIHLFLFVYLSIYLSIYLPIYLSINVIQNTCNITMLIPVHDNTISVSSITLPLQKDIRYFTGRNKTCQPQQVAN